MMEKQKRRAAVHNLGCKVNAYETEAMQQLLEEAGYEIVAFEEKADVYLINTCSVTNMADRKSRQMLHRARKQNPDAVIVAAGCYVQEEQEAVLSSGDADLIIGNNQKSRLVQLLETYWNEKERRAAGADQEEHAGQSAGNENRLTEAAVLDMSHVKEYEELSLNRTAEHTRAFIKSRTAVISSAATASSPICGEGSEAGRCLIFWRRWSGLRRLATKKWSSPAFIFLHTGRIWKNPLLFWK